MSKQGGGETIGCLSLLVAIVGVVISVTIPEVRCALGFEACMVRSSSQGERTSPNDGNVGRSSPDSGATQLSPLPRFDSYKARVTQPIGLRLYESPSRNARRIDNDDHGYNEKVTVLGSSVDGEWNKVRTSSDGLEGWVKSGDIERID